MSVVTDWIVAGSASCGSLIAGVSLFFLIKYVEATRRQVDVSQDQLEATMRPILVISEEKAHNTTTYIGIKNVSSVPALNVSYQTYGEPNSPQWQQVPVLTKDLCLSGGDLRLFVLFKQAAGETPAFEVEYESATRRRYRTIGEWVGKDLTLILTIQKL